MKSSVFAPSAAAPSPALLFVDAFDGHYARITASEQLPPFLMNVVSSSDFWMFLASNGGLTAGRINAEHALFPYLPVDRLYDSAGLTGPCTALRVATAHGEVLWEPLAAHTPHQHHVTRALYKSIEGDRVWFEETNHDLQLVFRAGWASAETLGFVRRCELENLAPAPVALRLLDGLRNFLPPGIGTRLQTEFSCLADAYKTAELLPDSSLATYALSSGITDLATPIESLRATAVWSDGLLQSEILLSDRQFEAFHRGAPLTTEHRRRGLRCAYALTTSLNLLPRAVQRWQIVIDTDLTQQEIVARRRALTSGDLIRQVPAALAETTATLRRFVASADGLQWGAAEGTTAHHFANTLFNVMRGGIFAAGYEVPTADFTRFAQTRNRPAAERHAAWLAALPASLALPELHARLATRADRDLERLGYEYLPLTFSRRHGDPSRPWNTFNIRMRDATGGRALNFEGNWRDIFQNWEALCLGFPEYLESIIAKFVNASTADGYNPYRVSREGVEWEEPAPHNPWAGIGYWGDHQTIYLLKLLEWSARFHPALLASWLRGDHFSYADVPYRIAGYAAMAANPRDTISFVDAQHHAITERVAREGSDGRLVHAPGGGVLHVNLTEKLLLLILTRLTNFIPGGGIWMNTQRPEWNDANNALVGYGVSIVTLAYLRRFVAHMQAQLLPALGAEPVAISTPLATLLDAVQRALDAHAGLLASPAIADQPRRALVDQLGQAGTDYRASVYAGLSPERAPVAPAQIATLLDRALAFIDHTLRASRREDGLYQAYNLLEFTAQPPALKIHHLAPMLEGQVAVLSAGLLPPDEVVALLRTLRVSPLYRPDQHSYLLYPDRELPPFVAKNIIPAASLATTPVLEQMLAAGDTRLVLRDGDGHVRFHADLVNVAALDRRLQTLAAEPAWRDAIPAAAPQIHAAYEAVFHHHAFTGRSGTMFAYEGVGSIYWHMVAKLLLAVQENYFAAESAHLPAARALAEIYYDIRAGLGFNKSPAAYGAFPTDPYSHTPGHAGAQQPGMTGQVKEEILSRFGELGVRLDHGQLEFRPTLLRADEFTSAPSRIDLSSADGAITSLELPSASFAFTVAGTPVIYQRTDGPTLLRAIRRDGTTQTFAGTRLDADLSREVFLRTGQIQRIDVELGRAFTPYTV